MTDAEQDLDLGALPDERLNELFAVEVMGLKQPWTAWQRHTMPQVTTDANAVLTFLDRHDWSCTAETVESRREITVSILHGEHAVSSGTATTFARAAVLALLTAKRAPQNL